MSLLSRMGLARRAVARSFGLRFLPVVVGLGYLSVRALGSLGLLMDGLFFRGISGIHPKSPIVLVGNPRTGTTFLHRWLHDQGIGRGLQLYRMLYPSLTQQWLIGPFLPLLKKVDPTRFHGSAAHETGLDAVETDDAAFFSRFFDGFLYYSFFLAHDEEDHRDLIDPEKQDNTKRDFDWLDQLWRRSVVTSGNKDTRIIAKLFSTSVRMPAFQERFPDAKVLYMARDPLEQIPSTMSLVTGVLDGAFGFWKRDEAWRQRYLDRIYTSMVELMRRFNDDWTSGRIDQSRVFVVPFHRLMQDFETLMGGMLDFAGVEVTPALLETIKKRGEKQRAYKSGHKYDLAQFGLDEDRIRTDCAFFYQTFLPDLIE